MKRTSILVFSVALICCFAIPGANAQTKKALRLGDASAVIGGLENGRSAQAADLTSDLATDTADQKAKAKATVKERLKGYGLVVANVKTAKTNMKELELVTAAASDLGIDVVLEDVDGKTMAKLYGIGADATAVAVKTDPVTKVKAVYSFDEEETGELKVSEPDDKVEQGPAWKDRPEKERADIEKEARAKGLTQSDKITTKESGPKPQKTTPVKTRHTRAEISKMVDKALKEPMPLGSRQAHDTTVGSDPPDWAFEHFFWYSSSSYLLADGTTLRSNVNWEMKMLAAKSPAVKRIQIFTSGTGANAYPLQKANSGTQRYYYLRGWETIMNPTAYWISPMTAWDSNDKRVLVNTWDPKTANREYSSSFTSGWSVNVGASPSGPEVGGSYSEQTTTNYTTKDFELRGAVIGANNNAIRHTFTGSKPDYASLQNKTMCDVTLNAVPSAAWDTFMSPVFGEWQVANNTEQGYTSISLTAKATYGRVEIPSRSYDWTGCLSSWTYRDWWYSTTSTATNWYVWWGAVNPGR